MAGNVPAGKSILASDIAKIIETERKQREVKRTAITNGNTNDKKKSLKIQKERRKEMISSLRNERKGDDIFCPRLG